MHSFVVVFGSGFSWALKVIPRVDWSGLVELADFAARNGRWTLSNGPFHCFELISFIRLRIKNCCRKGKLVLRVGSQFTVVNVESRKVAGKHAGI